MRSMMRTAEVDGQRGEDARLSDSTTNRSTFWVTPSVAATRTKTGHRFIGPRPSKKKIRRSVAEISELTNRRWMLAGRRRSKSPASTELMVGWANYFCLRPG